MSYLFLILVFIAPAFANLDSIHIKNLDLNYVYPEGQGEFEKLSIGVELSKQTYPVQIYRREKTFDIISPFVDFQWLNPITFVHNAQKVSTTKLNLNINRGEQYARGESLSFVGEKTGEILLNKYDFTCVGTSVAKDPVVRLQEDCLNKMDATVSHMELPFEFLTTLASQLPDVPTESEAEMPAHDFSLTLNQGDFYSYVRIKYVVRAYLKIWGHTQMENNGSTLAIRVDQIKYGILPVTTLVMNELRRQVRSPNVTIDPPWIRIKLGTK